MWAKILACVLAAGAVVGIGVYAALPPGAECNKCGTNQVPPDCPSGGCCPLAGGDAVAPVDNAALAACTGGLVITEETKASSCPVGACCAD
jgi:hypothetical protein